LFLFLLFLLLFLLFLVESLLLRTPALVGNKKKKSMQGECGVQVVEARRNQLALPAKTM
jgi:NADH:ubiquinone oxidoreductase subunit 3 (subunit A)